MPTLFKKTLLSFLAFLVLFFSVAPSLSAVKAQSAPAGVWYNQGMGDWFLKVYDTSNPSDIFGERYTAAQVQWVFYGTIAYIINTLLGPKIGGVVVCALSSGTSVVSGSQSLSTCITPAITNLISDNKLTPNTAQIENKSILGFIFADRPMSGISYTRNLVKKFSLVPVAKAQTVGFGFSALAPIQEMWKGSRNIAFGLFVLISVIFAFMIMFRVKLNPQTVVSVQSAIPKVILALIEVTFSYAIAGFLIDLMYVVIGIISIAMSQFTSANISPLVIFNTMVFGQILGTVQIGIIGLLSALIFPLITAMLILLLIFSFGTFGLMFWILFLPFLIACVLILWLAIKTIWGMLKAFANIILLTVFAPFQIALGVLIPNFGFGAWIKSYISHLSTFVVTGALIILSIFFMAQGVIIGFSNVPGGSTIVGSLLQTISFFPGLSALANINTSPWPPLLGSGDGKWVGLLFLGVSFVLFTMIPKATELVQSFLAGKPFAYGSAIGEAFGPVNAAWNSSPARLFRDQSSNAWLYSQLEKEGVSRVLSPLVGERNYRKIKSGLESRYYETPERERER